MASISQSSAFEQEKQGLGWMEWLTGLAHMNFEALFQRFTARNLKNPFPLPRLNDITCIVTGSTSGIGLEIARQLAESEAHVVMAVRNPRLAYDLIEKWKNSASKCDFTLNVEVMELDLLSLESVVKFSESWNSRSKPLNILINNAGVFSMGLPQKFSKDGYETHMQVNHIAPALLTILLLPSLKKGGPSRIVNVNTVMHLIGFVDPNDMNFLSERRKFSSSKGYANSKLAQIMFASVLQKRVHEKSGISVICVHPGSVQTNVARDIPRTAQIAYRMLPFFFFSAQEGSRSVLFSAIDCEIPKYCEKLKANEWPVCAYINFNCCPTNPSKEAHNVRTSQIVWEKTLEMTGLPSDVVEKLFEGKEAQCRYGDSP